MLALITAAVLLSTEGSDNALGDSYQHTLDLPVWVYTAAGAVIFLALLGITFAFRSTGKRH